MPRLSRPRGLLFDYGGTLVEEVSVDVRAGNEWLLSRAAHVPDGVTLADVLRRADRVTKEVAGRRDEVHLETPWPTLTRLIHDQLGIRFDSPMSELALGFWQASVRTREMPGARKALERLHRTGLPMAVVSNTSFGAEVIRDEMARHGLAGYLSFVMVSSDYSVRKPNVLLFDTAAARLGIAAEDIWFVGDRLDTDIAGAAASGMTAVWFNPRDRSDPSSSAHLTVSAWDEFTRHVLDAGTVVS